MLTKKKQLLKPKNNYFFYVNTFDKQVNGFELKFNNKQNYHLK